MNSKRKSAKDSSFSSKTGECETFWLAPGPPFDQRDYMISPSESTCVTHYEKTSPVAKKNKLGICGLKIDQKYLLDSQQALKKIVELIRDGFAHHFVNRLQDLIFKFLQGTPPGFIVEDLSYVIEVVEYFSRNRSLVPEYEKFVKKIMQYSKEPPKTEKNYDFSYYKSSLVDYFTLFGELLATFEDENFQMELLEALNCLIVRPDLVNMSSVKLSLCHEAMEESYLPYTVATLIETISNDLYPHYLDLALQMLLVSIKAGQSMIQNNILHFVLWRIDLFSAVDSRNHPKLPIYMYEDEEGERLYEYYKLLKKSGYLIWGLLAIISKCDDNVPCPGDNALWSLRYVFLREARKTTQKALDARNNLAGIIIKLLSVFKQRLPIVQTGLADGIAKLAVITEVVNELTWLKDIKFGSSKEDFILRQLTLLGCCLLTKKESAVDILRSKKVLEGALKMITTTLTVSWNPSQFVTITILAFRLISALAPKLPVKFVSSKGNTLLLNAIKMFMKEHFDQNLLLDALKTLCVVVTVEDNRHIINDIKAQNGVEFILDLCLYILNVDVMKIQDQDKLCRVFVILEKLLRNDPSLQTTHGETCVLISTNMLKRVLADFKNDSKLNPRLLVSFGGFFWEAVVWCQSAVKLFVDQKGIFLLLDCLELSSFPVQILFLGAVVDMTDEGETIAHLLTWRGKTGFGILNMMIDLWRKEEMITKVHRTRNGVIKDVEAPLMTEEQWFLTHQMRGAHPYSPSIAEMVCSVRPKVHALYHFLLERYFFLTRIGESSYCLQVKNVKSLYKVYIPLIEHYLALKMGEVWFEVLNDSNICGVLPTSFDGGLICTLLEEKNKWAVRIKNLQEEILSYQSVDEIAEEKHLYDFLKSCRLSSSLEALSELDYVSRTSFRLFQTQKKQKQMKEVKSSLAALPFPEDANIHRTYLFKTNATCLCGDSVWIISEKETTDNSEDIRPVSPDCSSDNFFKTLDNTID